MMQPGMAPNMQNLQYGMTPMNGMNMNPMNMNAMNMNMNMNAMNMNGMNLG